MKKYLAEFTGTFAIVFFGTGTVVLGQEMWPAINQFWISVMFGFIVMAMIYAFGDASGAHFNPAVSIAFSAANKFPPALLLPYMASQFGGAAAASALLHSIFPANEYLGSTNPSGTELQSFIIEFFLALFLMLIIMSVAHGFKEVGRFAGLLIGIVIFLEAYYAGPITGASMNPARSFGPALVSGHMEHLWIYLVAPTTGTITAVIAWRATKLFT